MVDKKWYFFYFTSWLLVWVVSIYKYKIGSVMVLRHEYSREILVYIYFHLIWWQWLIVRFFVNRRSRIEGNQTGNTSRTNSTFYSPSKIPKTEPLWSLLVPLRKSKNFLCPWWERSCRIMFNCEQNSENNLILILTENKVLYQNTSIRMIKFSLSKGFQKIKKKWQLKNKRMNIARSMN